jgi:hypothetical protein
MYLDDQPRVASHPATRMMENGEILHIAALAIVRMARRGCIDKATSSPSRAHRTGTGPGQIMGQDLCRSDYYVGTAACGRSTGCAGRNETEARSQLGQTFLTTRTPKTRAAGPKSGVSRREGN